MTLFDILGIATLAFIPAFILLDLVHRARNFDSPRFWRARALAVTVATVALSMVIPLFWAKVTGDRALLDLSGLGHWAGAAVGIVVYELLHYAYHRAVHGSDVLFRWAHQMHHSAESLDAWGAYYLSPLDTFGFTTISSLVFFPLLGLTPEAGIIGALFLTFNAMFQHANLRTPRWLGYIIQRPESHIVHHQRGLHRYNYADLAVIDMIFGTFRNPEDAEPVCGFWNGASSRIGAMLLGRDVTVEPAEAAPVPALEEAA
jgi:sterol desaturase/sphingolipid hydroxylase (fatty acid hydroxylase superfamily)